MSDTPPHGANGRDRTPELTSKREKRTREDDDREEERNGDRERRHRHRDDDDDRDRRRRHRDEYDERDRDREHRRHRDDETEEEREERRRRRRERDDRERGYDERERDREPRDRERERDRESGRERERERHRDRSRESHRSHRSREVGREDVPAVKAMSREEKEAERERRDREMMEERRNAARLREERFAEMDREREMERRRRPYSPDRRGPPRSPPRRGSPMYDGPPPPRGPPSPRPAPPDSPPPPKDPAQLVAETLDKENRSVFVSQISVRMTSNDLGMFFEDSLGPGTVRDAKIVQDRGSRRSKGIGYVELDSAGLINRAIGLSGTIVMGIPIIVRLTEAERNHEGKSAAQLAAEATALLSRPRSDKPPPREQIHFPPLSTGLRLPAGLDPDAHKEASVPYHRLYVTNLAYNLTAEDLDAVFQPYGQLEFVDLHMDYTGQSKGTAYIQYRELRAAQMALDAMHAFELAGRPISVQAVEERARKGEVVEDAGYKPRMDNQARQQLMQKLARGEASTGAPQASAPRPTQRGPGNPTPFVLVTNMFNPDEETERNWDLDLAEDVKGEVERQYGRVRRIKVDKMSRGDVYIEFTDMRGAERGLKGLNGRFFGGRELGGSFISEAIFNAHM